MWEGDWAGVVQTNWSLAHTIYTSTMNIDSVGVKFQHAKICEQVKNTQKNSNNEVFLLSHITFDCFCHYFSPTKWSIRAASRCTAPDTGNNLAIWQSGKSSIQSITSSLDLVICELQISHSMEPPYRWNNEWTQRKLRLFWGNRINCIPSTLFKLDTMWIFSDHFSTKAVQLPNAWHWKLPLSWKKYAIMIESLVEHLVISNCH